ncbi:hypothetical protein K438DRAFT_1761130 [Mycena galopus ATCC 62051]|nr:hypothetical protein K438DRAFT_1761130 [Mycena galopus ATCC 62051]
MALLPMSMDSRNLDNSFKEARDTEFGPDPEPYKLAVKNFMREDEEIRPSFEFWMISSAVGAVSSLRFVNVLVITTVIRAVRECKVNIRRLERKMLTEGMNAARVRARRVSVWRGREWECKSSGQGINIVCGGVGSSRCWGASVGRSRESGEFDSDGYIHSAAQLGCSNHRKWTVPCGIDHSANARDATYRWKKRDGVAHDRYSKPSFYKRHEYHPHGEGPASTPAVWESKRLGEGDGDGADAVSADEDGTFKVESTGGLADESGAP